ncbi:transcriptional regulator [Bacillus pseudomycoides]|nr:helix-turn-helix domain-containing protein [Bacillus pseudomycoides]MED1477131.1 helix-turn-helix domain-containing protein [Bacillus pseudomycoides]OOR54410.1 transcriptional regulator [Bacillus pseudomycoides]PEO37744.1 transcriptional regulator [Bacillus pseudomycoides]PFW89556.1 transcriptional regulator [Bacillus pseudomycoides]PFX45068.1 transcriptional regulator [Bacillus pseudomycoides]
MKCRLRGILDENGIKYSFFAEKVNIQRSTMSLILNEKSIPTLPVAIRIAKALNMHVEDIWVEEETEDK